MWRGLRSGGNMSGFVDYGQATSDIVPRTDWGPRTSMIMTREAAAGRTGLLVFYRCILLFVSRHTRNGSKELGWSRPDKVQIKRTTIQFGTSKPRPSASNTLCSALLVLRKQIAPELLKAVLRLRLVVHPSSSHWSKSCPRRSRAGGRSTRLSAL